MGGQGGQLPTQILAEQLILSQLVGADCAPRITEDLEIICGN